jgi:hypothetical protein
MKCAECKEKIVHYHGNPFCKECSKIFYEGEKDESIEVVRNAEKVR